MLIAPLEYRCRVCTGPATVYVKPIGEDDELVIDADGYHRLAQSFCETCESQRTFVATPDVPGDAA